MPNEIRFLAAQWAELVEHVLADGDEHAAILICGSLTTGCHTALLVREVIRFTDEDMLDRSALHLSVDPVSLARAAKRARQQDATMVVCHSHPFPGAVGPSPLDLDTEAELCGRALLARLAPRPVGALIVGPDGVSARLYSSEAPEPARVRVLSDRITFADYSAAAMELDRERHDRQVRAWGPKGQQSLAMVHAVIVGVGGTGSQVATQLAHLGVEQITMVDPDLVEETNLSRILGSTPSDVGRPKVDVVAAAVHRINPQAQITRIGESVLDIDPEPLGFADVIFCCTDGHGSRSLLTELAHQYCVPVVDMGVEITTTSDGTVTAGGGVRVLLPGRPCLHCLGTLDPALVREEYLTDDERAHEHRHGYLRGSGEPTPSVVCLNGVVASLAVAEFCQLFTGVLGRGRTRLLYRANERALTTAASSRNPSCHICGSHGVFARGDASVLPTRWRGDTLPGCAAG